MQFLKDGPFLNLREKPVALDGHLEATIGFVVMFVMKAENPGSGLKLSNNEFREFDKALRVLEEGVNEHGYYVFEDSHFATLKKVCGHNGPLMNMDELRRASPVLEELLGEVTARIPREMEEAEESKGKKAKAGADAS